MSASGPDPAARPLGGSYPVSAYLLLGVLALVVGGSALLLGRGDLGDPELRPVLLELRATRVGAAFLAGAALGLAGVLVQGLFRNALASPSILGTTTGAALFGQLALLLHASLAASGLLGATPPAMIHPLACLLGALASLAVLLLFVRRGIDRIALLLTGFILSALFGSLGSFVTSLAQEEFELGRAIVAFSLGGVGGVGPQRVLLALPIVTAAAGAAWFWGRPLDLLLAGEEEAGALGVDVGRARRWTVIWAGLATGAAVSLGGNVTFVGLVVPHALRPIVGASHRRLVPAVVLAGGAFLVLCDVVARVAPTRSEAPLGVITGLIGAPVFLVLLLRAHRQGRLDG